MLNQRLYHAFKIIPLERFLVPAQRFVFRLLMRSYMGLFCVQPVAPMLVHERLARKMLMESLAGHEDSRLTSTTFTQAEC